MKNKSKIIFSTLVFGIITVLGFISFGFYSMEIEDHYGDLQEFYYKSKDGDIVINKSKADFGILEKDWKRIYVKQSHTETELFNWIYEDGFQPGNEVYRTDLPLRDIEQMAYHEIIAYIKEAELQPIVQY